RRLDARFAARRHRRSGRGLDPRRWGRRALRASLRWTSRLGPGALGSDQGRGFGPGAVRPEHVRSHLLGGPLGTVAPLGSARGFGLPRATAPARVVRMVGVLRMLRMLRVFWMVRAAAPAAVVVMAWRVPREWRLPRRHRHFPA